jgi:hypothetical protein
MSSSFVGRRSCMHGFIYFDQMKIQLNNIICVCEIKQIKEITMSEGRAHQGY